MKNKKQTFESFETEFYQLLKKQYGLEPTDGPDVDYLKRCFDNEETASEVLEFFANKYDLDKI